MSREELEQRKRELWHKVRTADPEELNRISNEIVKCNRLLQTQYYGPEQEERLAQERKRGRIY